MKRIRIGCLGIIFLSGIFIILKLTNYINWDWFWILSPITLSILAIGAAIIGLGTLISYTGVKKFIEEEKLARKPAWEKEWIKDQRPAGTETDLYGSLRCLSCGVDVEPEDEFCCNCGMTTNSIKGDS